MAQIAELRYLLDRSCFQMQRDYALKKLMDKENERLRKRLYEKTNKRTKKQTSGLSRHMTSEESLDALAREEWALAMKEVFKDRIFKARRDAYEKHCKTLAAEVKMREKEAERAEKDAERNEVRRRKEIDKFRLQEERKRKREREKALRDVAKLQKAAAAAAAKADKASTRQRTVRAARQRHVAVEPVADPPESDEVPMDAGVVVQERPRPRRVQQPMAEVLDGMGPTRRLNRRRGAPGQ
jgi:hypothetical protein